MRYPVWLLLVLLTVGCGGESSMTGPSSMAAAAPSCTSRLAPLPGQTTMQSVVRREQPANLASGASLTTLSATFNSGTVGGVVTVEIAWQQLGMRWEPTTLQSLDAQGRTPGGVPYPSVPLTILATTPTSVRFCWDDDQKGAVFYSLTMTASGATPIAQTVIITTTRPHLP